MQNASKAYKESMKGILRNRGYIKVYIGVINSAAQKNAEAPLSKNNFTVFSDALKPFDGYEVKQIYATSEQDFSKVDGSMFFLPDEENLEYYNNGIVTDNILGEVYISFKGQTGIDIKGLTIDFGDCYPVDFTVENDSGVHAYSGNDKRYWTTEDVFYGTSYFIIRPSRMVNGNGRLRIYQFTCGIANVFTNSQVKSFTRKEYISSISDSIPSIDMSLTVENYNLYYSTDNPDSALAFMEEGQEMRVAFGYDVFDDGNIEWLPEKRAYLKKWSASDTEAKFTATDKFDYITSKYYRGLYRESGISLYDLAIDVLNDAGVTDERDYFIDPYLKKVIVRNPMPAVKHSEALQIIANAGRCALYEDNYGKIHMKSSFVPDMTASDNGHTNYSNIEKLLKDTPKKAYAICSNDFSAVDGSLYFMPDNANDWFTDTGYVSKGVYLCPVKGSIGHRLSFRLGGEKGQQMLDKDGIWSTGIEPKITIDLEASFVMFGLIIRFRNTAPQEFEIRTYNEDIPVETFTVKNSELEYVTYEEFQLFDKMEIIFTKGYPNARVVIDNILMGDVTDYVLSRNNALTDAPTAVRQSKIKNLTVVKHSYQKSTAEVKDLKTETVTVPPEGLEKTVYFTKPSYGFEISVKENDKIAAEILESSNYFCKIHLSGDSVETSVKYAISGYEYTVSDDFYIQKHNENGQEVEWDNPLIETDEQAKDIEEWLSSYYLGDVDYQIKWRGDPRTEANDLFYLDLKDRGRTLIRAYQNEIKFNGGWSGTLKARKAVMSWQ